MKLIPIFFSFDNNYVPQAAVTFESLLTNANSDIFYELFVVHSGLSTVNIQELYKQVEKHDNAKLQFINIKGRFDIDFSDDLFCSGHANSVFTIETLYRCLPMLLPEFSKYEKIIYSDVDIVVVDDISDLFNFDLSNNYIAGIHLPNFLIHQVDHLPQNVQNTYIGGGLWIMNLKKMREDNIGNTILTILKNPPCRLIWNDQDVINLACTPHIQYISYRYCSIPSWGKLLKDMNYEDEHYPNKELYDAMYIPKIVHYAASKPWAKENRPPLSDLWYYWLSKTNFHNMFDEYVSKESYKAYLFNLIPLPKSWTKVQDNKIRIKLFGFLPFIKIRKIN